MIALLKVPNEHSYRFCLIFPLSEVIAVGIPSRLIYRVVKYIGLCTPVSKPGTTATTTGAANERFAVPRHASQ